MRAIQENGGGRLTLISEDINDCEEIKLLCELVDVIKHGGTIMVDCEKTHISTGLTFLRPQQLDIIDSKRQPKKKK